MKTKRSTLLERLLDRVQAHRRAVEQVEKGFHKQEVRLLDAIEGGKLTLGHPTLDWLIPKFVRQMNGDVKLFRKVVRKSSALLRKIHVANTAFLFCNTFKDASGKCIYSCVLTRLTSPPPLTLSKEGCIVVGCNKYLRWSFRADHNPSGVEEGYDNYSPSEEDECAGFLKALLGLRSIDKGRLPQEFDRVVEAGSHVILTGKDVERWIDGDSGLISTDFDEFRKGVGSSLF